MSAKYPRPVSGMQPGRHILSFSVSPGGKLRTPLTVSNSVREHTWYDQFQDMRVEAQAFDYKIKIQGIELTACTRAIGADNTDRVY